MFCVSDTHKNISNGFKPAHFISYKYSIYQFSPFGLIGYNFINLYGI